MNAHTPLALGTKSYTPLYWLGDAKSVTIDGVKYGVVKQTRDYSDLRNPDDVVQRFSHAQLYLKHLENKFSVDRGSLELPHLSLGSIVDVDAKKARRALYLADAFDLYMQLERLGKKHPLLAERGWKRKVSLGRACLDEHIIPIIDQAVKKKWTAKKAGNESFTMTLPAARHFKRLYELYCDGNCDPRVLVSRRTGPGGRTADVHPADMDLWIKHARSYASLTRPSMRACLEALRAELEELNLAKEPGKRAHRMPSRNAFESLIKGMGEFILHAARYGEDAAIKKFAAVRDGLTVVAPGERVEMDEWKIDLHTWLSMTSAFELLSKEQRKALKRIRIWVTVAIDVATRCILALRFSTRSPSAHSSLAALEMVVTSKEHIAEVAGAQSGWIHALVPRELVTDAGSAFIAAEFRQAVAAIHCTHTIPPAGMASARGTIESVFRTFGHRFMHYFEGRSFSSVDDRGDYEGDDRVSLNVDEICRCLTRAILDIYHNEVHGGLGESPNNAWLRASREYAMLPPLSGDQRRRIFGTKIKRQVSARGIRFFGIHYQSRELQRLWAERAALPNSPSLTVDVRVDRFNIRTISYHDGSNWVDLSTELKIPDDVSVWEWTGAWDIVAKTHRSNADVSLSVVLEAVNDLRKAGTAAAARAELGTDVISAGIYRKVEKSRFAREITDDLLSGKDLAALAIPHDPLTTGIEEFGLLVRNKEELDSYLGRTAANAEEIDSGVDDVRDDFGSGDSDFNGFEMTIEG